MTEETPAPWQAEIEERVRERLRRHPGNDRKKDLGHVIESLIGQERERLERKAQEFENQGDDIGAKLVRYVTVEWLPVLARKLRRH